MSDIYCPIEVLLVEDSPADVKLTVESLVEVSANVNLTVLEDGTEAMAYLRKEDNYASAVRPDIILLDLNLPKKDGREVLIEIKKDKNLKRIPVIILTTSSSEEDIYKTYNVGANAYITKPLDLEQFIKAIDAIKSFWFTVAKLPTE